VYTPYCQIGTTDRREFVTPVCDHPHALLRFRVRSVRFGVTSEWSTPITIRSPSHFSPTLQSELLCEHPFDNNGVFSWIGTLGGRRQYSNPLSSGEVTVITSCKWYPVDSSIYVEREPKDLRYDSNHPCSWIEIDLGEGRLLLPTRYCLRGFRNLKSILKSWELQGKKEEQSPWISVRRHHDDSTIVTSRQGQSMVFLIAFDIFEFFSWIKMRKECLAAESNCMELSFRSNEKRLTKCPQPPTRVDSPLSKQLRYTSSKFCRGR
jgi:hypothetical protein